MQHFMTICPCFYFEYLQRNFHSKIACIETGPFISTCRRNLTSTTGTLPITNQMHLFYPFNQSDAEVVQVKSEPL